jgi:hypothetical protein
VGLRLFGSRFFNAPHALCETRVRSALGENAYANALRDGARLGLDEAVQRAVRGSGTPRGAATAGPSAAPRTNEAPHPARNQRA